MCLHNYGAEPERQFQLVVEHVQKIRQNLKRSLSKIVIVVERNLGFEAEHHEQALRGMSGVSFYTVRLCKVIRVYVGVIVFHCSS